MNRWIAGMLGAAALGGIGYLNYRRFVPKAQPLGGEKYNVRRVPVQILEGNYVLQGTMLIPEGIPGKLPTVICSHGLNSNGRNAETLVGMSLAMSGFAVCCFDFRGGSLHSRSGGRMWEMSVFTERDDLNAVIDYVKACETTDTGKLFLLGESQGGLVTAITAAGRPEEFRALIEYYPAFCIPEDARRRHGSPDSIPDRERLGPSILGRVYNEAVLEYDVYKEIPAYQGPVLIIHGDNDQIVPVEYGRKAAKVYADARFVCLPGEIHGFTAKGKREAAKLSYDFLREILSRG